MLGVCLALFYLLIVFFFLIEFGVNCGWCLFRLVLLLFAAFNIRLVCIYLLMVGVYFVRFLAAVCVQ